FQAMDAGPVNSLSNTVTRTINVLAVHFSISAPATATAGVSFSFTVTAQDQNNNTATGYIGTVHFTSTDGQAVLPADATLTNGVGTFTVTLKTAGSQSVTVNDTVRPGATGSARLTVAPAAVASLRVTAAPGPVAAGAATSVTVAAPDARGHLAT